MTKQQLAILTAPFDPKTIGVKVQSFNGSTKTKAMLVLYAQHTDVANRLDESGLEWSFTLPYLQQVGQTWIAKGSLIVGTETRDNCGDGNDVKAAASDAFKRAAMLFGVGRYLYDSETVWVPYNDATDKYKVWTYDEYLIALKRTMPVTENKSQQNTKSNDVTSGPLTNFLKNYAPVFKDDKDLKNSFYCEVCGARHVLTQKGNWVCPTWIKETKDGGIVGKHSKSFSKDRFQEMIDLQLQRHRATESQMGLRPK